MDTVRWRSGYIELGVFNPGILFYILDGYTVDPYVIVKLIVRVDDNSDNNDS